MTIIKIKVGDKTFEIERRLAERSKFIKDMLSAFPDDNAHGEPVPISTDHVTSDVFKLTIQWLQHHADDPPFDEHEDEDERRMRPIPRWDEQFFDKLEQGVLFDLINAANYLDIQELLHLACKKVAHMMIGKSPEAIREMFNIENDLTDEEVAKIKKDNEWHTPV